LAHPWRRRGRRNNAAAVPDRLAPHAKIKTDVIDASVLARREQPSV
jgi:hypothetical protein